MAGHPSIDSALVGRARVPIGERTREATVVPAMERRIARRRQRSRPGLTVQRAPDSADAGKRSRSAATAIAKSLAARPRPAKPAR